MLRTFDTSKRTPSQHRGIFLRVRSRPQPPKQDFIKLPPDTEHPLDEQQVKSLRRQRIKRIYEDVFSKLGPGSAQQLYKLYFADTYRGADVENDERRLEGEEKRRRELVDQMVCRVEPCRNTEECQRLGRLLEERRMHGESPSGERLRRIKNYGRWYLRPEQFGDRLRTPSPTVEKRC